MRSASARHGRAWSGLFTAGLVAAVIVGAGGAYPHQPAAAKTSTSRAAVEAQALKGFSAIHPIDIHTHVYVDSAQFKAMLRKLNLHILDINDNDDTNPFRATLEPQLRIVRTIMNQTDGRVAWCTTWDADSFTEPNFEQKAIRLLNKNFADGAVAVKMWKNIGMEVRRPDGKYVLPDDPVWQPILKDIAAHNKTLLTHLAEPDDSWEAPNPANPDSAYYQNHPFWYAYRHPEMPSKATILASRDHLLQENPGLRVIGCHLGSMETSLKEIAEHLDRYPNFVVDTTGRVVYLAMMPRAQVRAFMIKYQDRILYGTDEAFYPGDKLKDVEASFRSHYARDWQYFATDQEVTYEGHKARGLALPHEVLVKLYRTNAEKWIPSAWPQAR